MSTIVEMHPFARRLARDRTSKPRACRNLFGSPNKDEVDHILQTELLNTKNEDISRYNFDFDSEKPIPGGKYEWDVIDAQDVPAFYRSTTVAESGNGRSLAQRTQCFIASEPPVLPVQNTQNIESQTLTMGLQARLSGLVPEQESSTQTNSKAIMSRTDEALKAKCTSEIKHNSRATKPCKPTQCRQNAAGTSNTSAMQPKITDFLKQKKSSAKRKAEDAETSVKRRNISPNSTAPEEALQ